MRIGHGYDVHRLVSDRKLILGGVEIDFDLGLDGHSDADVLIHSVCDALLGAAALGDIGKQFPDSSNEFLGIDSRILLKRVAQLLCEKEYRIENIDCIVIAQRPRLSMYIEQMRKNIATDLGLNLDAVNIKATTEESLGFTGRGEGISAHAVCLIEKI